ncbi:hypothetical protein AZF37_04105 [endosymbiont 'TC1' of Trimyema compressum]|nr:hypothetical protein AZF37_04105 [endosymbiont 'TC1' of Trimyema compressum]
MLIVEDKEELHNKLLSCLDFNNIKSQNDSNVLSYVYYKIFSQILSDMFDSLVQFEEFLVKIELSLIENIESYSFEKIVTLKSKSFQVKKYLRLLLYVGDQLLVNENELIPQDDLKYVRNIDLNINRLYESSESIHEMCEHLMGLYDSTISSKTNNLINKLTIFTVFATPLTVISGIYGMNFIDMPELQHEYGYFIVLGIMLTVSLIIFFVLKKIKLL